MDHEPFGVRWQAQRDTALDFALENPRSTKRCRAALATALQNA